MIRSLVFPMASEGSTAPSLSSQEEEEEEQEAFTFAVKTIYALVSRTFTLKSTGGLLARQLLQGSLLTSLDSSSSFTHP